MLQDVQHRGRRLAVLVQTQDVVEPAQQLAGPLREETDGRVQLALGERRPDPSRPGVRLDPDAGADAGVVDPYRPRMPGCRAQQCLAHRPCGQVGGTHHSERERRTRVALVPLVRVKDLRRPLPPHRVTQQVLDE
ncbi:hypothetical protein [Streptomyces sp. NPDC059909]|uniref:hypothetical protein n=1 Tax=Streptomyces sp. NPDC059909 TaxID=3346998 RepID=UPI0036615BB8